MYTDWNLKRVHYPPYRPAWETPMEEHPPVPAAREHRLYQMNWLRRVYQFGSDEIDLAFDNGGFLSLEQDPKTVIAMENLDAFPMDLNSVAKDQLLRIPGGGPISADRIMQNRRLHSIDNWRDLQAMGVVRKRAWPYVVFPGLWLASGIPRPANLTVSVYTLHGSAVQAMVYRQVAVAAQRADQRGGLTLV